MTDHMAQYSPVSHSFGRPAIPGVATLGQAGATAGQGVVPSGMPGATPQPIAAPTGTPAPTTGVPAAPTTTPGGPAPAGPNPMGFVLMMGGLLVFMVVMTMWTGRREKKKREALLATIKRGDKVRMSGGLIGVVHEMTDTEVVVRMEEGRARFDRSAVSGVLKEAKAGSIAEPKDAGKALSV